MVDSPVEYIKKKCMRSGSVVQSAGLKMDLKLRDSFWSNADLFVKRVQRNGFLI